MTNNHNNSIITRHLEQITDKRERIVSEPFALGFLHLLNGYLLDNDSLSFKQEVVVSDYWLTIILPVSFNVNDQLYRIQLPFKVFVLEHNATIQFILIEQFVASKFGIDFDTGIIDSLNRLKLVYLDDNPSLALVFNQVDDYQQTMESLVMACYELLFEDNSDELPKSLLS